MPEHARLCALCQGSDPASLPRLASGNLHVRALPLMGHVLLQVPGASDCTRVSALIDLALPPLPNQARGVDPVVLWLGPRAWVVLTIEPEHAARLASHAAATLREQGGDAVDLTDAYQTIRVTGQSATALLAQGCPLDLEGPAFGVGAATRTLVGRTPVIVHHAGDDDFTLHVDRSLARQLWQWLSLGVDEIAGPSVPRPTSERSALRVPPSGRNDAQDLAATAQPGSRHRRVVNEEVDSTGSST